MTVVRVHYVRVHIDADVLGSVSTRRTSGGWWLSLWVGLSQGRGLGVLPQSGTGSGGPPSVREGVWGSSLSQGGGLGVLPRRC